MKSTRFFIVSVVFWMCFHSLHAHAQNEINTLLMNSTFEISGPGVEAGNVSFGTVFILFKPSEGSPQHGYNVLVTAAHVFDGIAGDDATLSIRRKAQDGTYTGVPLSLKIRQNGKPLFVKHSKADVAAMYVALPSNINFSALPVSSLADDARLEQLEVHPGDELLCLGFPLNTSLNTFPVLRSGLLASYPLTPAATVGTYYYNFHVFPGNSGGPVYFNFINRMYRDGTHIGQEFGVIGLVAQLLSSKIPGYENTPLDISLIVPSTFIRETINQLPVKPALSGP